MREEGEREWERIQARHKNGRRERGSEGARGGKEEGGGEWREGGRR